MKLILLTGEECAICDQAVAAFNKQFGREIAHEEAKIINLDENEAYQEKWMVDNLPLAPVILLETDEGKIVSTIPPEDLLGYTPVAEPEAPVAAPPAEKVETSQPVLTSVPEGTKV